MSNIIKGTQELLLLRDILTDPHTSDLNKEYLEEVLNYLLPRENGDLLIQHSVKEKGYITAIFKPSLKMIQFSINRLNEWLDNNTQAIAEEFNVKDASTLRKYLFLFILSHEIEHSYQYLMSEGKVEVPEQIIQQGYKGIVELFIPKSYILPRPIKEAHTLLSTALYKAKENSYVLERNANVEATDLLCQCALNMYHDDMYQLFNQMKNTIQRCGYTESTMGSFEETYRGILRYGRYKKFSHDYQMSEEDKVRYGLSITEETREKVLQLGQRKMNSH